MSGAEECYLCPRSICYLCLRLYIDVDAARIVMEVITARSIVGAIGWNYPAFKGPMTLYVLRRTPDGVACVLTSSNSCAGVPSAKKRFPDPKRTGETISTASSASPCSSSIDVSVELPERTRPGPSCDLMRRTSLTRSGPTPSNRSEEHTSELQSRFGISYAVFCLNK